MKTPKTFILTIAIAVIGTIQAIAADAVRPNIVFILADDLGYGDLSCYGQKILQTANLDRMAAEGMRFTRHYAGLTVCAPSRCVLMTGKHTGHASVRTNYDPPMSDQTPTIAKLLTTSGYATGAFGKWGIGDVIPEEDPNRKGFDTFYGYVDMYHAHNLFPPFMVRNGKREQLGNVLISGSDAGNASGRGNGLAQDPKDYAPDRIVSEALKFIDMHAKQPFFLYLALNTPHANNEGGKGVLKRGMEVPDFGPFANRDWPDQEKGFARMMQDVDLYVAHVFDKLRQQGIDDRTLVIFTSDNGPHQEGGHHVDFFDSNGALRGRKRDLYEGGIRVPMIARWPGKIPPGTTSHLLSGFQDYLPTYCEMVGIAPPESDGISILPTMLGKSARQAQHEYLYWEFYEGGGKQAIATDRWKAVRLNWIEQPDGLTELYDIQNDLAEEKDISNQHPEIVQRMTDYMKQAHTAHTGVISLPNSKNINGSASPKP